MHKDTGHDKERMGCCRREDELEQSVLEGHGPRQWFHGQGCSPTLPEQAIKHQRKNRQHTPEPFASKTYTEKYQLSFLLGRLSKADKELVIVATSVVNRCPCCVIAHGALHRIYSKQPALADQVIVNWKLSDLSDQDLAMLEFAVAVCTADNITEEHFQKVGRHSFDREDAWDVGMISAFFAMSNRIAHYIDLRPNKEFYAMGRTPCGEPGGDTERA
ncbi:uncharacterized protein LOC128902218 isoform X2 [Rissa tridactyla]|uniref:uncharacterized protein LOC128902218 isoform X2 n=1 Tax=Rissa tridactyla TaxID=75485 RepID=UPI0023BA65B7|nr:uncharacterized protein LOC128902218 isoform X2 [Rissa tridactyla]